MKGTRNAYSLSLDPVRRWLSWGDVGPDFSAVSEENNLVKEPHFTGWPYFAGQRNVSSVYGSTFGIKNRAINGPIMRYDGSNPNPGQIPPRLDRKWLVGDCNGSYGNPLLTLNEKGDSVIADIRTFDLFNVAVLVDMQQGPDGALYYIGWQTGIYRAEYKGSCKDPALTAEKTGCADALDANYDAKLNPAFHDPRLCAKSSFPGSLPIDGPYGRRDLFGGVKPVVNGWSLNFQRMNNVLIST